MQVRMVIIPGDDGLNVIIWGKWADGSMRVRQFDDRTTMIATLQSLGLISSQNAAELERFAFIDSCPLFSAEIEEDVLDYHDFDLA